MSDKSIKATLGNGGKHRKEIYEVLQEVLGKELNDQQRTKVKKIVLEYVSDQQEDAIKRLQEASVIENNLKDKLRLLTEEAHLICKHCKKTKNHKKF